MVLETMWFRAACLGFFAFLGFSSFFLIIFIPFSSLLGIFAIFGGILVIFGGKRGFLGLLEAF